MTNFHNEIITTILSLGKTIGAGFVEIGFNCLVILMILYLLELSFFSSVDFSGSNVFLTKQTTYLTMTAKLTPLILMNISILFFIGRHQIHYFILLLTLSFRSITYTNIGFIFIFFFNLVSNYRNFCLHILFPSLLVMKKPAQYTFNNRLVIRWVASQAYSFLFIERTNPQKVTFCILLVTCLVSTCIDLPYMENLSHETSALTLGFLRMKKNNSLHINTLCKKLQYNQVIERSMWLFKSLLTKSPKNTGLLTPKAPYTTMSSKKIVSSESQADLAIAITKYFQTIFSPTPEEVLSKLEGIKNGFILQKALLLAKSTPASFLAKKLFQIAHEKKELLFQKKKVLELAQEQAKMPFQNKLALENPDESASITSVFEIVTGQFFVSQNPKVQILIYRDEKGFFQKIEIQKDSLMYTGQKNCDLEVTFRSKLFNAFKTLTDILIGKNSNFKGNLMQINTEDITRISGHRGKILKELQTIRDNTNFSPQDKAQFDIILNQMYADLAKFSQLPNQILIIQHHLIELIPLVRRYNPLFNPNFVAFFTENPKTTPHIRFIAKIIQETFSDTLSEHSTNKEFEQTLKKALPIFVKNYHIEWEVMSPMDRTYCLSFLQKYAPHLYAEIIAKL